MLFAEPPKTRYDVKFVLAGIPVRIDPWFWIVTVMLAINGPTTPTSIAIWVVAMLVSILIHELGHALAFRHYGFRPRIALYSMGGLAMADATAPIRGKRRIFISAAGPGIQLLLAAAVIGLVLALGYQTSFLFWRIGSGEPISSEVPARLVASLIYINLGWALVNLLPVHPLDGGNIAHELLATHPPQRGLRRSLWLSIATGVAMALIGLLLLHSTFTAILFGYLAFMSFVLLRRDRGQPLPPFRELGRKIRARWARSERSRRRKKIESATLQLVHDQEQQEQKASAEVEQEAHDLLKAITEDVRRSASKAKPPPGDGK